MSKRWVACISKCANPVDDDDDDVFALFQISGSLGIIGG